VTDRGTIYEGADLTNAEVDAARKFTREKQSTSYLQRRMQIPYSHAVRLMELLEAEGWVTEKRADGSRRPGPAMFR
jgi:DNA segregation ATPase FtsK/SpoIIIE-like protein